MAPTLLLPSADIPYVAVLGCLVIPIAFACFVTAPRYIPAPEFSLVVLLEMVLGPYWVWLGLGERPAHSAFLGGAIVLITLVAHSVISLRSNSNPAQEWPSRLSGRSRDQCSPPGQRS